MNKSLPAISEVPFYGDTIEAIRTPDGVDTVVIKRICESVGIDFSNQLEKLKAAKWSGIVFITTPDKRGRSQRVAVIPLESLPMWLTTIHPSKIKAALRPKLERYQCEAKAVLSAWFLGTSADMPDLAREIVELKSRLGRTEHAAETAKTIANMAIESSEQAESRLNVILLPFSQEHDDYMTIRQFCDEYHVRDNLGRSIKGKWLRAISRNVAAISLASGIPVRKLHSPIFGTVNAYSIEVLVWWRMTHDIAGRTPRETFAALMQRKAL